MGERMDGGRGSGRWLTAVVEQAGLAPSISVLRGNIQHVCDCRGRNRVLWGTAGRQDRRARRRVTGRAPGDTRSVVSVCYPGTRICVAGEMRCAIGVKLVPATRNARQYVRAWLAYVDMCA